MKTLELLFEKMLAGLEGRVVHDGKTSIMLDDFAGTSGGNRASIDVVTCIGAPEFILVTLVVLGSSSMILKDLCHLGAGNRVPGVYHMLFSLPLLISTPHFVRHVLHGNVSC